MYEGAASTILGMIKDEVMQSSIISKFGVVLLKPVLKKLMKKCEKEKK